MTSRILLFVAITFSSTVFADVLLPPGSLQQTSRSAYPQQQQSRYHIEYRPIYIPSSGASQYHSLMPYHLSSYYPQYHNHLIYKKVGGVAYIHPSLYYGQPYHPLIEHYRYRRSTDTGSNSGKKTAEISRLDVATKSPLDIDPSVDDSQKEIKDVNNHLAEKETTERQSKNTHPHFNKIVGFRESAMYPGYYHVVIENPKNLNLNSAARKDERAENEQLPPQRRTSSTVNLRGDTQEHHDLNSQVNHENLQQPMAIQKTNPSKSRAQGVQENTLNLKGEDESQQYRRGNSPHFLHKIYESMPRNYPDPTPFSDTHKTSIIESLRQNKISPTQARIHPTEEGQMNAAEHSAEDQAEATEKFGRMETILTPYEQLGLSYAPNYCNYFPLQNHGSSYAPPTYVFYKNNCGSSSNMELMQSGYPPSMQYYQYSNMGEVGMPQERYIVLPDHHYNTMQV